MKKSVALLMRASSTADKSGLSRYAKNVRKSLEDDVSFIPVDVVADMKGGVMTALLHGLIRPSLELFRRRRQIDVIHAADELCCLFFPFTGRKRKILTVHHVTSREDRDTRFFLLWRIISKIGILWADEIIAISSQTKREIEETFKVEADRITVIPNMVSDAFVTLGVPKRKYIGCVSTLIARKNVAALLRSFKTFTGMPGTEGYSLRICGTGYEYDRLVGLAGELGISDRVEFISGISEEELVLFYNEAAVIANPSMHEGFGFATLEAQSCSTPVVVFKDARIPEEVVRSALKADDETNLAEKMHSLITDPVLYGNAVNEGLEHVRGLNKGFRDSMMRIYRGIRHT